MIAVPDIVPKSEREPYWINPNVLWCDHGLHANGTQKQHMKVIGMWGNAVWICESCLRAVKRELTPTAL